MPHTSASVDRSPAAGETGTLLEGGPTVAWSVTESRVEPRAN